MTRWINGPRAWCSGHLWRDSCNPSCFPFVPCALMAALGIYDGIANLIVPDGTSVALIPVLTQESGSGGRFRRNYDSVHTAAQVRNDHTSSAVGIKEVDDGIWLVSFMDYDLGYIDLEEKTLQPLANPVGPKAFMVEFFCSAVFRAMELAKTIRTRRVTLQSRQGAAQNDRYSPQRDRTVDPGDRRELATR